MPSVKPYKKIRGGSGASLVSRHSLWAGDDHLLAVTNTFGVEAYRKYYFGEIQALVSAPTKTWLAGLIALGLMDLLFVVIALVLLRDDEAVASGVLFGFGGVLALFLAIHAAAGRSAKLYVQTATSFDRLEGVARARAARRVVQTLGPLIRDAQRGLPPVAPPAAAAPREPDATADAPPA